MKGKTDSILYDGCRNCTKRETCGIRGIYFKGDKYPCREWFYNGTPPQQKPNVKCCKAMEED